MCTSGACNLACLTNHDPFFDGGVLEECAPRRVFTLQGAPDRRQGAAIAPLTLRGSLVIFGGRGLFNLLDSVVVYVDGGFVNVDAGPGPGGREFAAMAEDRLFDRVVLFGGDRDGGLGDTWLFDGRRWTQGPQSGPSPRSEASASLEPSTNKVVLFGGRTATGVSDELWEWSAGTWTKQPRIPPWPPARSSATLTTANGRVLLFGGRDGTNELPDLWEWDGARWTLLSNAGPARSSHAAAWDPVQSRLLVFGGRSGATVNNQLWEWTGSSWRWRSATLPPDPREAAAMHWFPPRNGAVVYGGAPLDPNASWWVLQ